MLLATVLLLIGHGQSDASTFGYGMSQRIETELQFWKAKEADRATPPAKIWVKSGDLSGKWSTVHFLEGASIALTPTGQNRYEVAFETGGCLARWKLSRTATFSNGTLTLNKPVQEYLPATYDRLYLVRSHGKLRLVSPKRLRELKNTSGADMFAFERVDKDPKSKAVATLKAVCRGI